MSKRWSQSSFIQEIIIPFCQSQVDSDERFIVYGLDGKIIISSNALAQYVGYKNWQEISGKADTDLHMADDYPLVYRQWELLRKKTAKEQRIMYYINILPIRQQSSEYGFEAYANFMFPLFMPNGKVVAIKSFIQKFKWLNPIECFAEFYSNFKKDDDNNERYDFELSGREYEIIFALYIGLTQEEAALFLNMTRSNLVRILHSKIYPQFNVTNEEMLIEKITACNFIRKIPSIFSHSRCIVLDNAELAP